MTQTILGAGGQIAEELARELGRTTTGGLRLVSRKPRTVAGSEHLVRADLLDASQTDQAVAGSEVVYFTAGLPANTELWEAQFPAMLRNALEASRKAGAKFAYFDNTYMYPQDDRIQTEETAFAPVGRKGEVRAQMAAMVLGEMDRGDIPVLIARAPEFYGPSRTQGFTNSLVIDRLKAGRRAIVPVNARKRRSLIWTPDASRALAALGNASDSYGQSWHLPIDDSRPTYQQFIALAAQALDVAGKYTVAPRWALRSAGLLSAEVREIQELLPRYAHDNHFDASKFRRRFPDFQVTTYRKGLSTIGAEASHKLRG